MNDPKNKAPKPAAESDAVAPAPSPTAPVAPVAKVKDDNHGKGGAYEIRNGQRVLVQRTKRKD